MSTFWEIVWLRTGYMTIKRGNTLSMKKEQRCYYGTRTKECGHSI